METVARLAVSDCIAIRVMEAMDKVVGRASAGVDRFATHWFVRCNIIVARSGNVLARKAGTPSCPGGDSLSR